MATITNYTTLKQAIADWVNSPEIEQTSDQLIQFVEADLNTRLRCREMIVRATTNNSDEFVKLPADWLEGINLQIQGGQSPLRFITLDEADIINASNAYTQTRFYSLMNGAIELVPPPGGYITIEMVYYAKIPALSDSVATNWLITKAPDVYLYGAMAHAAPFLKDDPRIATFSQMYLARVQAMQDESQKSLHSGSPLIARTTRVYG